jgi:peptidoglycan/xylan/chitin deacetylase (PgdA/CDA1 family)
MRKTTRIILALVIILTLVALAVAVFTIFFDQAVLVRKGTVYHQPSAGKLVAITFDDGPSPLWTPRILIELERAGVKATFFMLGKHVALYPQIARQVAKEGHEIENHSYNHNVLIYYKMEELQKEIKDTEKIIKELTGKTTKYFRPPKALLTRSEKKKIREMGYEVVLWSLNSKDWVTFDNKYIIKYLVKNVQPGDIILFHDSGRVFGTEGGDRKETVLSIVGLVKKLQEKGYRFVTVDELLRSRGR